MFSREVRSLSDISASRPGPRGHQILHPVRSHIAGEDVFDLRDLSVFHFEAETDDQGLVQLLHDSVECDLAAGEIDGIDFECSGSFGGADPQSVAHGNFGGVLGQPHALGAVAVCARALRRKAVPARSYLSIQKAYRDFPPYGVMLGTFSETGSGVEYAAAEALANHLLASARSMPTPRPL